MPTLTLYVRDEDNEVFKRAKELTDEGSLSQIIAKALRNYLERKEVELKGMKEIDIKIGDRRGRTVRFIGRIIAEAPYASVHFDENFNEDNWIGNKPEEDWTEEDFDLAADFEIWRLYQTRKGKILHYRVMPQAYIFDYSIYDSYKDFLEKGSVSKDHPCLEDAEAILGEEAVEFLDI